MKKAGSFSTNARAALADATLQRALADMPRGFAAARAKVTAALPEFEALRRTGRDIKDHTLQNLDLYLEAFERNAVRAGSQVHWAATADDACDIILGLCREAGARLVTKSKSMVSEEIGLSARLEAAALEVVETDLGEYLVQIRGERPSHLIAPAIHIGPDDIAADFRRQHNHLPANRDLSSPDALVAEARAVLREKFLASDVGITGANVLVAETGSAIIVTNEGNADLTLSLPKVHIVLATIEKVVPTLNDAWALLRLLARSGTGQDITAYTTLVTGARRADDVDGATACHIVLLDNGRSEILGSDLHDVLRCIRCGACMNHCPVYCSVGGHAYESVYAGPIGARASRRRPPRSADAARRCARWRSRW
jgi:L-lactate dehydrogenase complex protein LldF